MLSAGKRFCLQADVKPITRVPSAKRILLRVPVRGLSQHHTGLVEAGVGVGCCECSLAKLPLLVAPHSLYFEGDGLVLP